jgi:putative addiction module component (TIGR02574 family)
MTRTAQMIVSEAIALTPTERAEVAAAILDSLAAPAHSDEEIRAKLQDRSAVLASGEDPGLTFEEVFGEPL